MNPRERQLAVIRHEIPDRGSVDAICITQHLPFATPEEVRSEVVRCMDILGKDGGYICGPDHHIKPDVSAENTVTLFDTATSHRYQRSGRCILIVHQDTDRSGTGMMLLANSVLGNDA